MTEIEIFSASTCPLAQRSRLVLIEKDVHFSLTEIDLENKPDWFLKISPQGRVPVIRHAKAVIWESAVINEYLEEVFADPPLMPQVLEDRARARIWVTYANDTLVPLFYKLMAARDEASQEKVGAKMALVLEFIEKEGLAQAGDGPYFLGRGPTLTDFTFYPFFERWPAIAHYSGLELSDTYPRLEKWLAAMQGRASVQAIANPGDFYIRHYESYD